MVKQSYLVLKGFLKMSKNKPLDEADASKDTGEVEKSLERMNIVIIGVIVALFIAFAAAFIAVGAVVNDYLAERHATNQSLRDMVKSQNDRINELTKAIQDYQPARPDIAPTIPE